MTCAFCNISIERGFRIVYEDNDFVVFQDIAPAARVHVQVVPKKHIGGFGLVDFSSLFCLTMIPATVRSLNRSDVQLVRSMREIGNKILSDNNTSYDMRKMGFHIPPFNSIDHLHLHVQAMPYFSRIRAISYPISKGSGSNHKGVSWFVEVEQAIQILQSGRRIGILPC
ncbi:HIT-like protein [Macrolepiota fuliginosa MF-IS2]|uniref:HIT-like protein n=1 Tax=Macrolepiota fuliginosa MF-IS2 TaxID=1400762 RepID=A0A9P5XE87_9AGAR|nr:HIT-like protein [Macrolepiota fuliginosa MF-IS2]